MALIENINVSQPNDGLGDDLRDSQIISNSNFAELNDKKVEKQAGKDLSDNNLTDELLNLINAAPPEQIQSDLSQNDNTQPDFVRGKEDFLNSIPDSTGGGSYYGTFEYVAGVEDDLSDVVFDTTDILLVKTLSGFYYFVVSKLIPEDFKNTRILINDINEFKDLEYADIDNAELSAFNISLLDVSTLQNFTKYLFDFWRKKTESEQTQVINAPQVLNFTVFGAVPSSNDTTSDFEVVAFLNQRTLTTIPDKLMVLRFVVKRNNNFVFRTYFFKRNNVSGTFGTGQANGEIITEDLIENYEQAIQQQAGSETITIALGDIGTDTIFDYLNNNPMPTSGQDWTLLDTKDYFFTYTSNSINITDFYAGDKPAQLGNQPTANKVVTELDFQRISTDGVVTDTSAYALKSNVLEKDNTTTYTPTEDYHPATKKYVDDNAGGKVFALRTVNYESFGDSMTVGQASTANNSYVSLIKTLYNLTNINRAVSGRGVYRSVLLHNANINPTSNKASSVMAGFNDVRRGGNSIETMAKISNCLKSIIVNQFLSSFQPANASSANVTALGFGASYTAATFGGKATGSFSQTSGDYLEYTFSNDNIVIAGMSWKRSAFDLGAFEVFIDGVSKGVFNFNDQTDGISDGENNNEIIPAPLFFGGLGDGSHVVRVVNLSNNYVVFDYFGHLKKPNLCTPLILVHSIKLKPIGYSQVLTGANDAVIDELNQLITDLSTNFIGSEHPIVVSKTNDYFNPDTDLDPDNIHPNNNGHRAIYQGIYEAMKNWLILN